MPGTPSLDVVLDTLLTLEPPGPFTSVGAFRAAWRLECLALLDGNPIDHALLGGALADRLGYAFSAGYAAALRRLVPALGLETHACLCVTEAGGGHPRAIRTTLVADGDTFRLTGAKRWATLAGEGDVLLVAASEGWTGDRNRVRLVSVPADAPGVRCEALPPTPFTPEIPHYEVSLDEVRVDAAAVLPGDGFTAYVKPFRTIEDLHVSAATAAYLLSTARRLQWPVELAAGLAAVVVTLRGLANAPPDAPGVHLALAGALSSLRELARASEPAWAASGDPDGAGRWVRDAPLLGIAEKARAARLASAWATFVG